MDAFLPYIYIQQLIANLFGNSGDVAGAAFKVVSGLDMTGLMGGALAAYRLVQIPQSNLESFETLVR